RRQIPCRNSTLFTVLTFVRLTSKVRPFPSTVRGAQCPAFSYGTAGSSGSAPALSRHRLVRPAPTESSSELPECAPVLPLPESQASNCPRQEQAATVQRLERAILYRSSE